MNPSINRIIDWRGMRDRLIAQFPNADIYMIEDAVCAAASDQEPPSMNVKNPFHVELDDFVILSLKWSRKNRDYLIGIPSSSGVYARYLNGELLYIGMSSSIGNRQRHHQMIMPCDELRYYLCDESSARLIERRLVAKHKPRFNRLLKS